MRLVGLRGASGARVVLRHALPLGIGALCLWLLSGRIGPLDMAALARDLAGVTALQWLAAGLATGISFLAIGQYDVVVHRHLRTGVHPRDAQRAGMAAIALGQVLGLGALSGALVRWRLIAPLSMTQAVQMSALVALSFLTAWGLLAGVVCAVVMPQVPLWIAALAVAVVPGMAAVLLRWPDLVVLGRRVALPSVPAAAAILALTTLDTAAAAAALHVLMPVEAAPGFALVFAAYLAALGAALLSGTPGGVGPFELVLLASLPQVPQGDLIAAIVAFRLVYYALPAVLALKALWRPAPVHLLSDQPKPMWRTDLASGARSEIGVVRQNGALSLEGSGARAAVVPLAQSEVLLFAPLQGALADLLGPLRARARAGNRVACLYKIAARDALAARRAGWCVVPIARDAVLDPQSHDIEGPAHRQLRRLLRKAEKAGVVVDAVTRLPLAEMARVHHAWVARSGGEHGLTMGRFCPDYIAGQRVFCARVDGRLVAFVTFHAGAQDWCLDLMRSDDAAPAGTQHLLVAAALAAARREGATALSLAAVPPVWMQRFAHGRDGLLRFKESFAPRWVPLYMAAPSGTALLLAAVDLWRGVHHPPALRPWGQDPAQAHHHDEDYEFASDGDLWETAPNPAPSGPWPQE